MVATNETHKNPCKMRSGLCDLFPSAGMYSSWASSTGDTGIDMDKHPVKHVTLSWNLKLEYCYNGVVLFGRAKAEALRTEDLNIIGIILGSPSYRQAAIGLIAELLTNLIQFLFAG